MPSSPRRASGSAPTARSRCWKGRTPAARASTASIPTATSSSSTSGRRMSLPDVASAVAARPADRPPLIDQYRLMLLIRSLRGARGDAVRAGRDLRHGAQLRRPGGDRRRRRGRDARDRLPRRPPPLARPPDRGRRRPAPDDGRDVRQADGLLQGTRRLDAHRRPLARHPRLQRHRRRRHPARLRRSADGDAARHRPGDARVLRRRRRRSGRHARGHEPRRDLEAARSSSSARTTSSRSRPTGAPSARSRISPTAPPATACRARSSTATTCSPSRTPSAARSTCARSGGGPTLPRDEDVPADAAFDAREPARRPRPCGDRRVGAEGSRCRGSRRSSARRASSTTSAPPRFAPRSTREVEAAVTAGLADEDASADDLLPAVFAPHRSYPAPPARGERELSLHGRDPRGARPRARGRPGRDRDGRGRRPHRRAVPRHRGPLRALRRRAHPRHAAHRERLRRLRHRRRAHRPAPRRRAAVLRLRRRRVRPDPQPGGEAAVHDGRHAEHAARAPDGLGRRRPARRAALAEPRGAVLPHPRARRRDALEPVRRQGPARGGDPGRQPGDLPRAEAPLLRRAGARAGGALRDRARRGARRAARARDVTIVALGAMVPHALRVARELEARGHQRRGRRPAHARPARHRHDRGLGREDAPRSSSSTRRCSSAASAPRSRRTSASTASGSSTRRSCASAPPSHPMPYQKDLELATLPGPARDRRCRPLARAADVAPTSRPRCRPRRRPAAAAPAGTGASRRRRGRSRSRARAGRSPARACPSGRSDGTRSRPRRATARPR